MAQLRNGDGGVGTGEEDAYGASSIPWLLLIRSVVRGKRGTIRSLAPPLSVSEPSQTVEWYNRVI